LPLWFREGLVLEFESDSHSLQPLEDISSEMQRVETILESPRSRAELERAYAAARNRVRLMIKQFGRDVVIGWLERGMPSEVR
jgi:hypothetical protein